jgi:PBP4 family serine-type D-alanyl-D-alanine carboxypeptidase
LERPELGEPLAIFREWAEKLKGRGIRRIAGDLIGEDAVFEEARPGRGWAWDDLAFGYAAENGGLQFNENVVLLSVRPGAVGELAVLQPSPSTSFIEIGNSLRTTAVMDLDLDVVRADRANRFVLKGSIPSTAEPFVQSLSVADPSSYFLVVLRETLEAAGIRIEGAVKTRRALTAELNQPLTTLHVHESPDLRYVLRVLLKTSQNLYAETLVKAVAPAPLGKSHADGRRQVERILTRLGVPPDAYQLADGSGLSRLNFLTADTLVRLLRHVYRQPYRADFLDCLPIAGVDGTLRRRMKGTAAAQNVRAKTGTLAHVRALSGYVTTRDGETLAFSMLANNFTQPLRVPEYAQDAALEYLANLSRQGESGYLRPRASAPAP